LVVPVDTAAAIVATAVRHPPLDKAQVEEVREAVKARITMATRFLFRCLAALVGEVVVPPLGVLVAAGAAAVEQFSLLLQVPSP
jgi:hypothetical protein